MATKKTDTPKREVYISMDRDEMAALRELGWRERWLYMELKWLANFKTGEVGGFGRQCITYEQLSGLVADEHGKALVMRLYDVFNATQIEGIEPRSARDHVIQPIDMADAMVEGMKTTGLSVKHGFRGASYAIDDDLVRMPEIADFHTTEDYYSTLLHECMHATGAYKRLNRLVPTARFGSPAYAREELRAELGAILCCQSIGIGTISGTGMAQEHIDNHASYIASWLQALKDDKNEIFKAAADAQRACDYIREHALKIEPKLVLVPEIVVPEVVVARRRGMRM